MVVAVVRLVAAVVVACLAVVLHGCGGGSKDIALEKAATTASSTSTAPVPGVVICDIKKDSAKTELSCSSDTLFFTLFKDSKVVKKNMALEDAKNKFITAFKDHMLFAELVKKLPNATCDDILVMAKGVCALEQKDGLPPELRKLILEPSENNGKAVPTTLTSNAGRTDHLAAKQSETKAPAARVETCDIEKDSAKTELSCNSDTLFFAVNKNATVAKMEVPMGKAKTKFRDVLADFPMLKGVRDKLPNATCDDILNMAKQLCTFQDFVPPAQLKMILEPSEESFNGKDVANNGGGQGREGSLLALTPIGIGSGHGAVALRGPAAVRNAGDIAAVPVVNVQGLRHHGLFRSGQVVQESGVAVSSFLGPSAVGP